MSKKKNPRLIYLAAFRAYQKDPTNLRVVVRYYAAGYNYSPANYHEGVLDALRALEEEINRKKGQQQ